MARRPNLTHAVNMLVGCVTKLTIHWRTFLAQMGVTEGPVINELLAMEQILPSLLDLRNEVLSDEEVAYLGSTGVPLHAVPNPPPQTSVPSGNGADTVDWTPLEPSNTGG